jgi:hypothetical protein
MVLAGDSIGGMVLGGDSTGGMVLTGDSTGEMVLVGDSRSTGCQICCTATLSTTHLTPTVLGSNTLLAQGQNKRDTLVSYWNMEQQGGEKCM